MELNTAPSVVEIDEKFHVSGNYYGTNSLEDANEEVVEVKGCRKTYKPKSWTGRIKLSLFTWEAMKVLPRSL